jgi:hypothetical protein
LHDFPKSLFERTNNVKQNKSSNQFFCMARLSGLAIAMSFIAVAVQAQTLTTTAIANTYSTNTSNPSSQTGAASISATSATSVVEPNMTGHSSSKAFGVASAGSVRSFAQTDAIASTSSSALTLGGTASASAVMQDSFIVVAGNCVTCTAGSTGTLTFSVLTSGSIGGNGLLQTTGNPGYAGGNWAASGDWGASGSLNTLGAGSTGFGNTSFTSTGSFSRDYTGNSNTTGSFGQIVRTVGFVFGGTNQLRLESSAYANASAGVVVYGAGGSAESSADFTTDFSHTLAWGGITEIKDSSGTVVTGFTAVSAASNFDYAKAYVTAVPEPETYVMLLAGLGVMGGVARRRKAKQAS